MGFVIMSGVGSKVTVPISGIKANTLAVGSTVKLMENNAAVEYLIVHQGLPSSLYDASCDGCWLLRKGLHSMRQWHTSDSDDYKNSDVNAWLNGDFFNSFGSIEQAAIKQVKIPYRNGGYGGTDQSGANGLPVKIFLLSGYEVGWTTSDKQYLPVDGAKLDYFIASSDGDYKRVAYYYTTATDWWLRDPDTIGNSNAWAVGRSGSTSNAGASNSNGIRPALILPSTAIFDADTLLLKGVA